MVDTRLVIVREMRGEDIEALAEALNWPWERIDNRWQELLVEWREIFVADVGGSPGGTVSINERPERPGLLHLFALDVGESMRNRGIGTRMIDHVEAEAKRRGLAGVYLEVGVDNTNARRLYERLGYVQDGKPFPNSWNRHGLDGEVVEVVEETCRLIKRFDLDT